MLVSHLPSLRLGIATGMAHGIDIHIVAEVDGDAQALALAELLQPDIILLDASLPGLTTRTLIQQLAAFSKIVVLDQASGEHPIETYLNAGALGCVQPCEHMPALLSVIHQVAKTSRLTLSPVAAQRLAEALAAQGQRTQCELTKDERETLSLVAMGKSSKQVGTELGISRQAVQKRLTKIFAKLDVSCRTQAVDVARRNKLLD
jgi:DNA-binding NarL/FixJ family response regulator